MASVSFLRRFAALAAVGACSAPAASGGTRTSATGSASSAPLNPSPTWSARVPAGAERLATREERLAGERVVIERLKVDCSRRADELFMPRVEQPSDATTLPRWLPRDCAEEIERIWMQRAGEFRLVGAYPTRGIQLVDSDVVRRFTSVVRLVGDQVIIADQANWCWLTGAWRPGSSRGTVEEQMLAEGDASTERVYRFDHDRLVVVRADIEATPAQRPPRQEWRATTYAASAFCSGRARRGAP